jgi:Secretion system C-terminal sorting domain
MKSLIHLLLFLPTFLHGQSLYLSDPLVVSTSGTGSRAPRVALLEGNRPVIYWGKTGSNPKLYLAFGENNGFGAPVEVSTNGIDLDLWGGALGPQIAARGNTLFLIFESYGTGIYSIKSDDGGQSFSAPVLVYSPPQGRYATLPSVAIDPALNPVVSFITTNANEQDARYEITHSTNGGFSFPPTTIANTPAAGEEVCECCPATIGAFSGDEIYLAFRNNDDNLRDIWVAKSIDGGASFTEATDIDDTDWQTQTCPQSGPDMMISSDSIYAVFFSAAMASNIYLSTLDKASMSLGNQFQITSSTAPDLNQGNPVIAGNGDTMAVVWEEYVGNNWNIQMCWSVNGSGELLNNRITIDESTGSQKLADIAYEDGQFHIVYEDQSNGSVVYRRASFEEILASKDITKNAATVTLSPNPFSNTTTVMINGDGFDNFTATLYTAQGLKVADYQSNGNELNITQTELNSGIYFLKIQRGDQQITERLIKF